MIPGLPDFAQGLTAVALLLVILAIVNMIIKREQKLATDATIERIEASKTQTKEIDDLNREIRTLYREMNDKSRENLSAAQSAAAVSTEAQKLMREMIVLIDKLQRDKS